MAALLRHQGRAFFAEPGAGAGLFAIIWPNICGLLTEQCSPEINNRNGRIEATMVKNTFGWGTAGTRKTAENQ